MDMSLFSKPPEKFDYSCLRRFIEKPERVTIDPSYIAFSDACRVFNYNPLLIWCLSCVLTNEFAVSHQTEPGHYNFLAVPDLNPSRQRAWRESIFAGCEYIKAKNPDKTLAGLDVVYEKGTAEKVSAVYEKVIAFWQNAGSEPPPVEIQVPDPLPPTPQPVPEPEKPKQKDPSAPSHWQVVLAGILGTVGSVWWLARMFLPGGVGKIGDVVIEFLKKLAGI